MLRETERHRISKKNETKQRDPALAFAHSRVAVDAARPSAVAGVETDGPPAAAVAQHQRPMRLNRLELDQQR